MLVKIQEMTVYFCETVAKPTFNTSKLSFCSGDSLKLTVTNINKGDTLKWYYGSNQDLTNTSSKVFNQNIKVFVTRTDSVGCIAKSDTLQISKIDLPNAPTISRDTANNLVSSSVNSKWYKDGTAIADTTQKFKPSGAGSYTVSTSQNGCTSVQSAAYYYLVTDIINLSADEFIKLAPNPFQGILHFDFTIKGYQKLNVEVFDITTGAKLITRQDQLAGQSLNFSQLNPGTYIIRVSSKDNKVDQKFKLVKI
jgi:hypothetical protein